jgi:hypothetical protein
LELSSSSLDSLDTPALLGFGVLIADLCLARVAAFARAVLVAITLRIEASVRVRVWD